MISLDEAPQGYEDFDKGAAKKFVLEPARADQDLTHDPSTRRNRGACSGIRASSGRDKTPKSRPTRSWAMWPARSAATASASFRAIACVEVSPYDLNRGRNVYRHR